MRRKYIIFAALVCAVLTASCAAKKLLRAAPSATPARSAVTAPPVANRSVATPEPSVTPSAVPSVAPVAELPEPPPTDTAPAQKTVYLTIDDGPSGVTPKVLDVLAKHDVKATFFVLPRANSRELYERIIKEGHALGNHTYSHDYVLLYGGSVDAFRDDVLKMRDFLRDRFNYTPIVFRFPGGSMGRAENVIQPRKDALTELGYRWFDWDSSFGDTSDDPSAKDAKVLAGNALRFSADKEKVIILMHDSSGKEASAEALDLVIAELKERGYAFATLPSY